MNIDSDDSARIALWSAEALLLQNEENAVARSRPTIPERLENVPIDAQLDFLRSRAPLNFEVWRTRFENNRDAYLKTPVGNLSTDRNLDSRLFAVFAATHARGNILDIGCGPLALPAYLKFFHPSRIEGIDPLACQYASPFRHTQAIAENLPFADETFQSIVIGTSLDHIYLVDLAVREMFRVLRPGGRVIIWTSLEAEAADYNPYTDVILPPDAFHLFHFSPAFLRQSFSAFDKIETFDLRSSARFACYEKPHVRTDG